jgi:hypothetical protein
MNDIDLTQGERKVLELLGKLHVSQNKTSMKQPYVKSYLPNIMATCMRPLKACTVEGF